MKAIKLRKNFKQSAPDLLEGCDSRTLTTLFCNRRLMTDIIVGTKSWLATSVFMSCLVEDTAVKFAVSSCLKSSEKVFLRTQSVAEADDKVVNIRDILMSDENIQNYFYHQIEAKDLNQKRFNRKKFAEVCNNARIQFRTHGSYKVYT